MLLITLLFCFIAVFMIVLAFTQVDLDSRPKLNIDPMQTSINPIAPPESQPKKKPLLITVLGKLAFINKALVAGPLGRRMSRDLGMAQFGVSPEEFLLIKQLVIVGLIYLVTKVLTLSPDILPFSILMSLAAGYYLPEMWLKARAQKIKDSIVRDLPDTVDLLGLCVNAGLDFMMALKYVVEKSRPSVIIEELKAMMQEISVGKPRRDALRDMARKYELPDLSTFSRTLIQADRMGTSVTEALNILSEDMREARFRRGETVAMKAPLKMLIPLLLFIFPVVAILVAGPVFIDFFQNNPLQGLGK